MDHIRQLWYGNLRPVANFGKKNETMRELERLMGNNLEELEKKLDEQGRKRLSVYVGHVDEYLLDYGEQAFYDGFCLGVSLTAQAMAEPIEE